MDDAASTSTAAAAAASEDDVIAPPPPQDTTTPTASQRHHGGARYAFQLVLLLALVALIGISASRRSLSTKTKRHPHDFSSEKLPLPLWRRHREDDPHFVNSSFSPHPGRAKPSATTRSPRSLSSASAKRRKLNVSTDPVQRMFVLSHGWDVFGWWRAKTHLESLAPKKLPVQRFVIPDPYIDESFVDKGGRLSVAEELVLLQGARDALEQAIDADLDRILIVTSNARVKTDWSMLAIGAPLPSSWEILVLDVQGASYHEKAHDWLPHTGSVFNAVRRGFAVAVNHNVFVQLRDDLLRLLEGAEVENTVCSPNAVPRAQCFAYYQPVFQFLSPQALEREAALDVHPKLREERALSDDGHDDDVISDAHLNKDFYRMWWLRNDKSARFLDDKEEDIEHVRRTHRPKYSAPPKPVVDENHVVLPEYIPKRFARFVRRWHCDAGMHDRKFLAGHPSRHIPLVSVVMCMFNASSSVEMAISSVLAQTYPNVELIVIDDMSGDESVAVALDVLSTASISWRLVLNEERLGTYRSRNVALMHAQGEIVAFQDADDYSLPGRLEEQAAPILAGDVPMTISPFIRTHLTEVSWRSGPEQVMEEVEHARPHVDRISGVQLVWDYVLRKHLPQVSNAFPTTESERVAFIRDTMWPQQPVREGMYVAKQQRRRDAIEKLTSSTPSSSLSEADATLVRQHRVMAKMYPRRKRSSVLDYGLRRYCCRSKVAFVNMVVSRHTFTQVGGFRDTPMSGDAEWMERFLAKAKCWLLHDDENVHSLFDILHTYIPGVFRRLDHVQLIALDKASGLSRKIPIDGATRRAFRESYRADLRRMHPTCRGRGQVPLYAGDRIFVAAADNWIHGREWMHWDDDQGGVMTGASIAPVLQHTEAWVPMFRLTYYVMTGKYQTFAEWLLRRVAVVVIVVLGLAAALRVATRLSPSFSNDVSLWIMGERKADRRHGAVRRSLVNLIARIVHSSTRSSRPSARVPDHVV
eukprot:TRINITY_DN66391_c8_g1_i4.p1 TRINITY_DN66391_c8_g1~~TRINITY_DN66391_c8_g1_i4.p1  ORF type:complete len:988 (-),score=393.07 TRINITY_DN66391_c8_g1_i4:51-2993(-)